MHTIFGKLFALGSAFGKEGEMLKRAVPLNGEDFIYQIFVPQLKREATKLPVVVFLHGIRERGHGGFISGMFAQLIKSWLSRVPAVVLFPQCRPGRYWPDPLMEEMVIGALEQTLDEFNADSEQISLIGVSMGGYGVWHFASRYPQRFAALVSICGGSPITSGERFTTVAEKVGQTPVWLFHGAEDRVVPVSESRQLVAALKARDGRVRYNEYEGIGHNVWINALAEKELLPWLLAQQRS